jgi:hypothetical protein
MYQASLRSKTRTLEQQNTNNEHQGDDRHDQARRPSHAAAYPPKQRTTHDDGNDDIKLQWAPRCAQREGRSHQPQCLPTTNIHDISLPDFDEIRAIGSATRSNADQGRRIATGMWRRAFIAVLLTLSEEL